MTKNNLNTFKKSYCTCLNSVSYTGFNSTLESNINILERNLKIIETNIRNWSNQTLNLIGFALKSTNGAILTNLQSLQSVLTKVLTISDYMNLNMTKLTDCNALYIRIQFLRYKQISFTSIFSSANLNFSQIISNRLRVNISATGLSSTSQKSVENVISSTMRVENNLKIYSLRLSAAIQRVAMMIGEISTLGDTYCSCSVITTAGSVTTTLSLTSSSTSTLTTSLAISTTSTTSSTTSTTTEEPTTVSLMPCGKIQRKN